MTVRAENSNTTILLLVVVAALAFAGGYYYFQQKDKDTLFNFNVGGKNISAEVERQ
jgi:hypothetical protein